jgi:hypothetical protein
MAKKSEAKTSEEVKVSAPQEDSAVEDTKKSAPKAKKTADKKPVAAEEKSNDAVPETVEVEDTKKKTPSATTKKAKAEKPSKTKNDGAVSDDAVTLESFGPVCKTFILENIRIIEYRDLAKLMGIKPDDLKKAVEAAGIRLPIERAMRWSDIDVGTYRSLMDCARCQVQLNHSTFFVGLKNCRKCIEQNIAHWIENGVTINLRF